MDAETRYAKSGGLNIAYQAVGKGPIDLVLVPGWVSHVEYNWEWPERARTLKRLASFSRLILFDKRGTGLSDPVAHRDLPGMEQRMDDLRAVLDAACSERAALLGYSEGGPLVGGVAVHIGARAAPDEVLVSSTVRDLVAGAGLRFTERGPARLKGIPGEWRLFAAD